MNPLGASSIRQSQGAGPIAPVSKSTSKAPSTVPAEKALPQAQTTVKGSGEQIAQATGNAKAGAFEGRIAFRPGGSKTDKPVNKVSVRILNPSQSMRSASASPMSRRQRTNANLAPRERASSSEDAGRLHPNLARKVSKSPASRRRSSTSEFTVKNKEKSKNVLASKMSDVVVGPKNTRRESVWAHNNLQLLDELAKDPNCENHTEETITIKDSEGKELRHLKGHTFTPKGFNSKEGITVLYLSGSGRPMEDYGAFPGAAFTKYLEQGMRVVAFDYGGFGQSSDIKPTAKTLDNDAHAMMAHVKTMARPEQVLVHGYSMGAHLATKLGGENLDLLGVVVDRPMTSLKDAAKEHGGTVPGKLTSMAEGLLDPMTVRAEDLDAIADHMALIVIPESGNGTFATQQAKMGERMKEKGKKATTVIASGGPHEAHVDAGAALNAALMANPRVQGQQMQAAIAASRSQSQGENGATKV